MEERARAAQEERDVPDLFQDPRKMLKVVVKSGGGEYTNLQDEDADAGDFRNAREEDDDASDNAATSYNYAFVPTTILDERDD